MRMWIDAAAPYHARGGPEKLWESWVNCVENRPKG